MCGMCFFSLFISQISNRIDWNRWLFTIYPSMTIIIIIINHKIQIDQCFFWPKFKIFFGITYWIEQTKSKMMMNFVFFPNHYDNWGTGQYTIQSLHKIAATTQQTTTTIENICPINTVTIGYFGSFGSDRF